MGIYLAVSLVFVMTTLLEFALVLFLQRRIEITNGNSNTSSLNSGKVSPMDRKIMNHGTFGVTTNPGKDKSATGLNVTPKGIQFNDKKYGLCIDSSLTTRIDILTFWLFILGYLTFNIIYWKVYQST